ncbi:hypothetical protein F4782DRAFT_332716 [Xylaria castorea]|nr:hypothetical protein F4782DRAFT_332716 [Xylaria castorea]
MQGKLKRRSHVMFLFLALARLTNFRHFKAITNAPLLWFKDVPLSILILVSESLPNITSFSTLRLLHRRIVASKHRRHLRQFNHCHLQVVRAFSRHTALSSSTSRTSIGS